MFVGECLCGNTMSYTNNHDCGEGHDGSDIAFHCYGFTAGQNYSLIGQADYDADFTVASFCSAGAGDLYCQDYLGPAVNPVCSSLSVNQYGYVNFSWQATQEEYWIWVDGWFGESAGGFCFEVIDQPTPTPTPTAVTGYLNGLIALERPGVTPPDPSYSVPLTVTLCSGSTELGSYSTVSDQDGYFLVSLPVGTYDILVKHSHTLTNKQNMITIYAGITTIPVDFGILSEGDANDDNAVTSTDFFILRDAYNSAAGDINFDARADFNEDQVVNSSDFFLLRNHYNQAGADCT